MKFITIFASLFMFVVGGAMIIADEDGAVDEAVVVECVENEDTEELECPITEEDGDTDGEEAPASD